MQGNWKVTVKSKNASFPQRFIISGAIFGNGTYNGTVGTSVTVLGTQWSIAIQNNPGSGFQLSDAKIKFPHLVSGKYEFDIESNDAGADEDFDDLVLTCSTPANINDFIIYGHASVYSGRCIFNPCRRFPFVIETSDALVNALRNPKLKEILEKLYPERIPEWVNPNPPDPAPFKPLVLDLTGEFTQPKTQLAYSRISTPKAETKSKSKEAEIPMDMAFSNFALKSTSTLLQKNVISDTLVSRPDLAKIIDGLYNICTTAPAPNLTLSFEEYDRTASELTGGAYTGTGNRRFLGDTITDAFGNYIFRFRFDMTFPGMEDSADVAGGEDFDVVAYPDVIVKIIDTNFNIVYESAPHNNIPNLKRIDLCLPKSTVVSTSTCFNGNLIGSLGNIFIGGDQNSTGSFAATELRRYGYNNFLEENGKISVHSSLAGFSVDCAAWHGVIDMKGCMYDLAKSATQNKIKWYTIRIKRAGTPGWNFVSQNYKHPKFSKRHLANYNGDDVGPFNVALKVDGGAAVSVPAYTNIQREIFVDGVDWEFTNLDRYMKLDTALYDLQAGVREPGTFYVKVDGYDGAGNVVAKDMIALFIHNLSLNFQLTGVYLDDINVLNAGCGLFRLRDDQMNVPMKFSFRANDPYGFVNNYLLGMSRCPAPTLALQASPMPDTAAGATALSSGSSGSVYHTCDGYTGTTADYADAGLIEVTLLPDASEGGWIKTGEYYTVQNFGLTASKRVTNGYNTGVDGNYQANTGIAMERLNP